MPKEWVMTMPIRDNLTRDRIESVIVDTLASIRPELPRPASSTTLIGEQAVVDSVGFITLLVAIEQNLDGAVDLSASFMEQSASDDAQNPFRTLGSLTDHICLMLSPG
jgi:hypothetical protein